MNALGTESNVSQKCHSQDADHLGQVRKPYTLGKALNDPGSCTCCFPSKVIHSSKSRNINPYMSPVEPQMALNQGDVRCTGPSVLNGNFQKLTSHDLNNFYYSEFYFCDY